MVTNEKVVYYNANSKNAHTGDCVKRALSLAYNIDYNQVSTELNRIKKEINAGRFNNIRCVVKFMENHGGYTRKNYSLSESMTEEQFCEENPTGTYIVISGKSNKNTNLEHMVTISNGNIYDSWDSSKYYVKTVFTPDQATVQSNSTYNEFTTDDYDVLCQFIEQTIEERCQFYSQKYGKEWDFENIKFIVDCDDVTVEDNNVKAVLTAMYYGDLIYLTPHRRGDHYYFEWEIPYVFNIRFSIDEIKKQIQKVSDNYVKHCCWKIIDAQKEAIEHQESYKKHREASGRRIPYFRDGHERRVFNALPAWARNLCYDFDSYGYDLQDRWYEFRLKPLANDENPNHEVWVRFEGSSAREITYYLNEYKKDPTNYDDTEY